jgi:hypothetical protein
MNTITIWPRLIAVIDNGYATALDNAYISLSFMLNSSFLSAVMAFLMLIVGLLYPIPLATPDFWIPWVLEIGVFAILAYVFYLWATDRAGTWGRLMEGAVDLYRWKLLEQLGYTQRPDTKQAERELWRKISAQMIIGDSPQGPHVDYREEI